MFKGISEFDQLQIFSIWLGLMNYEENKKQTTNDDLLKELKTQDKVYLDRIIEQNELIISLKRGQIKK